MSFLPRPSVPLSISWARLLGRGKFRLPYGHDLAVNDHGEAVFVAHLLPDEENGETVDFVSGLPTTAVLLALSRTGHVTWSIPIHDALGLRAPSVAISNSGNVYLVGPYEPYGDDALTRSQHIRLTRIFRGAIYDSVILAAARFIHGRFVGPRPELAVSAAGIWVTWTADMTLHSVLYDLDDLDYTPKVSLLLPAVGIVHQNHVIAGVSGDVVLWGSYDGQIAGQMGDGDCDNYYVARSKRFATCHEIIGTPWTVTTEGVIARVPLRQAVNQYTSALAVLHGEPTTLCLVPARTHVACLVATSTHERLVVAGYFSGELCGGGRVVQSDQSKESIFVLSHERGQTSILKLPGTEYQNGLIIRGSAAGVLVGYWFHGTIEVGRKRFSVEDRQSAGFVLVKLVPEVS